MEKKLISEISRIQQLMGVQKVIVEQLTWLRSLATRSPKAFDNFTIILKSVRRPGTDLSKLTSKELEKFYDDIELKLRYSGIEGEELKAIMKELKDNVKIKNILTTTDDFLSDLLKYEDELAPAPALANLTKVNLTAEEIKLLSSDVLDRLLKDPTHNLGKVVVNIDEAFSEYLAPLINSGRPISNVDEIWDFIDDNLNQIVQTNVQRGNISNVDPKILYDELSEYMRTFSNTKKLLDGVESKNFPKRTTSIKYGDKRMKVLKSSGDEFSPEDAMQTLNVDSIGTKFSDKYNELINKPPNELTTAEKNFIKGVDAQMQGKTTNLEILFDEVALEVKLSSLGNTFAILGKEYNWFDQFYINVFRPTQRWWYANIETLYYSQLVKNFDSSFDMFSKQFEEAFGTALNQYIKGGKKVSGEYMREVRDKLLKLTSVSTEGFNSLLEKNAELVWDSFKTNAVKQLISPDEIDKFNQFVAFMEKQETSFRSKAITDLFDDASKVNGGQTMKQIAKESQKRAEEAFNALEKGQVSSFIFKKVKEGFKTLLEPLFSFYLGGTFKTPLRVELYMMKRGYTSMSAAKLLAGRLFWAYVFFPAICAIGDSIIDGAKKMENIKGKEQIVDPDMVGAPVINFVGMYYVPRLVDAFTGSKFNEWGLSQTGIPNEESWLDVAADALPGYADKNIVTLLEVGAGLIGFGLGEQGELTPQEKLDQEAKNQVNIVKETEVTKMNKNGQAEFDLAKQKDDELVKQGKDPSYVQQIENLQQNGLNNTKKSVNRLVEKGFISEEDAEFINKHLFFIPSLPLDFLNMVSNKQSELKSQAIEGSGDIDLKNLNGIFGDLTVTDVKNKKLPKIQAKNLGSVVLKINGKTFLTQLKVRDLYSLPMSVYDTAFPTDQGVVWITPEFSELKAGTKRTYNSMTEFIKLYKK